MGTPVSFKVGRKKADDYMAAMRQTLSRVRGKAAKNRVQLEEFKLIHVSTMSFPTHDEITMKRTVGHTKDGSVYDEIAAIFAKKD